MSTASEDPLNTTSPSAPPAEDHDADHDADSDKDVDDEKQPLRRQVQQQQQLLQQPKKAPAPLQLLLPGACKKAARFESAGQESSRRRERRSNCHKRVRLLSAGGGGDSEAGSDEAASDSDGGHDPYASDPELRAFRRTLAANNGLRERHRIHTSWRKEHKAFVTLVIVMGAFLLCWLPYFTWYLTVTICGEQNCPSPDFVVSLLFWIGYFNSTINPFIYVMTNRDFKDAFTDILRKIFCFCCADKGGAGAGGANGWGIQNHSNVDFV